jgi:tetratricopeptide (TPR) repeat protein
MAKICAVCKQQYADEQGACPHCGAVAPPAGHEPPPSGSVPDFDLDMASKPGSGDSGVVVFGDAAAGHPHGGPPDEEPIEVIADDSGLLVTGPGADPAHPFDAVEGSSADIDLDPLAPTQGSDSGLAAGSDPGAASDVVEVDWSSVAEGGSSVPSDNIPHVQAVDEPVIEVVEDVPPAPPEPLAVGEKASPPQGRPSKAADVGEPAGSAGEDDEPLEVEAAEATPPPRPGRPDTMPAMDEEPLEVAAVADEADQDVDLSGRPLEGTDSGGYLSPLATSDSAVDLTSPPGELDEAVLADEGSGAQHPPHGPDSEEEAVEVPGARADVSEPSSGALASALLEDEGHAPSEPSSGARADALLDEEGPALHEPGAAVGEEELAAPVAADSAVNLRDFASEPGPDVRERAFEEEPMEHAAAEATAPYEEAEAPPDQYREAEEEPAAVGARRPSRTGAWAGGGVVGLLAGVGACAAVYFAGLVPDRGQAKQPGPSQGQVANRGGAGTQQRAPENEPAAETDQLGSLFANGPLKLNDPQVQEAEKKLAAGNTADDLFQLGVIQESEGKFPQARKTFEKGWNQFKERRFQAAIERLEEDSDNAQGAPPTGNRQGRLDSDGPGPRHADATAALLAGLLLPAAEADAPGQPVAGNAAQEPEEAGYEFWDALSLARQQKYTQAISALEKARQLHEQRRFLRYGKALNPMSDPTGKIFLRAADQLKDYWQVRAKLQAAGYLKGANARNPAKAIDNLLADKEKARTEVRDMLAAKLKQDKDVAQADPDVSDLGRAIDVVLTAKDKAEGQLAALRTMLEKAKVLKPGQADLTAGVKQLQEEVRKADASLAAARKALAAAEVRDADGLAAGVEQLAAVHKAAKDKLKQESARLARAEKTIDTVAQKLEAAQMLPAEAGRDQVVAGLDRLLKVSHSKLEAALSRTPAQMLDIWADVLPARNPVVNEQALRDARHVAADGQATPAARAAARGIEGIVWTTQERYGQAREALEEALKNAPAQGAAWRQVAEDTLHQLTDPGVFFLPAARDLLARGEFQQALQVLNRGLEAFPRATKEGGRLLALASTVELARANARAKGKALTPADVAQARKDGEGAVAAGAVAEGHGALGYAAEALRDWRKAEQEFRRALDAVHDNQARNPYRLALARVLLRAGAPEPTPAPKPAAAAGRTGRLPAEVGSPDSMVALAAALLTGVQPGQAVSPSALAEARRLAQEAIDGKDPEGYLVLAQVLAREDRWTAALMTYVEGMEQVTQPPGVARGLRDLVQRNPAFKMPEGRRPPDPLAAEEHYAEGLRRYWAGRYQEAAEDFAHAIQLDNHDARYYDYFGLARLQQGNRSEALEAFRRGALLEDQGKPDHDTVNAALERVQGPARRLVDEFREKPPAVAKDK